MISFFDRCQNRFSSHLKQMKSTFKAGTLALISLVTSVVAIHSSALAGDRISPTPPVTTVSTLLGCSLEHNKEFTQAVVIKNITNQSIGSGKLVSVRVYYYGKAQGQQTKYTLTKSLDPGQSIRTSQEVSSESSANYTCKASY
jgi:hypothetical protein